MIIKHCVVNNYIKKFQYILWFLYYKNSLPYILVYLRFKNIVKVRLKDLFNLNPKLFYGLYYNLKCNYSFLN